MSEEFELALGRMPYWVLDLIPLFFLLLSLVVILKLHSKWIIFLLITVFAITSYMLSDYIFTNWWENLNNVAITEEDIKTIEKYSGSGEIVRAFMALFKAFILWLISIIIFLINMKKKSVNK